MVASEDDGTALLGQPVKPSELLWALRGGGAGSGVVYEWRWARRPRRGQGWGGGTGRRRERAARGADRPPEPRRCAPPAVAAHPSHKGHAFAAESPQPRRALAAGPYPNRPARIRTYPTPSKLTRCMVAYNVTGSPARFAQVIAAVHESWRPWQALPGNDYPVVQLFLNLEVGGTGALGFVPLL